MDRKRPIRADWSVFETKPASQPKPKSKKKYRGLTSYKCLWNKCTECSKKDCPCDCHAEEKL